LTEIADEMGLPPGIPVIASGHDTQFAVLGSGAGINQPVISSGTWEILMVRAMEQFITMPGAHSGITMEWDAVPGVIDLGVQWVGSGFLEWISRLIYNDLAGNYNAIIEESSAIAPGCNGVTIIPEIFAGGLSGKQGSISGFTNETTRAHIYRAALEALAFYTRFGIEQLQQSGNFSSTGIICTGGGSKNALWNQIRANVTGMQVNVPDVTEATALGAAIVAMTGVNVFRSLADAFDHMGCRVTQYNPDQNAEQYDSLYNTYRKTVLSRG
jgi:L-fuculokinase